MQPNVAKIAVSTAVYDIDKPYSYLIPEKFLDKAMVGKRVLIPFGRSNKKIEGIILKLSFETEVKGFKNITSILDETPLFDDKMLKLAVFMQKRYYATFYEIIKTMLPSGFWFDYDDKYELSGNFIDEQTHLEYFEVLDEIYKKGFVKETDENRENIKKLSSKDIIIKKVTKRTHDKKIRVYSIDTSNDEHEIKALKGHAKETRLKVIEFLKGTDNANIDEVIYQTGCSKAILNTLEKQGLIKHTVEIINRENDIDYTIKKSEVVLSGEQQSIFDEISPHINTFSPHLLYGVTGSGKTQIYIKLIKECLKKGEGAIVLIPEIALTSQLLTRFTEYFGTEVAVLHSGLSVITRFEEWKKIKDGTCKVVIGTRSAVFAPVQNLSMIIIDEEHEKTYKSEQNPRYDAREVAKYRTFHENALLLMASATPSVESYFQAESGKYTLHKLTERYGNAKLPDVYIYDMRENAKAGNYSNIGELLQDEIITNLQNKEQTILFLNRRGNSKKFSCVTCGYVPECINCSVNMTYHSVNDRIMCHFCGNSYDTPVICPKCNSRHIKTEVAGTQKIEQEIKEMFPEARVLRLDADTTKKKNSHNEILSDFKNHKADILIGTQMVTKGLDFENATLVGVIDADQSLFSENYLAEETTYAQITQVIGRAGRKEKKGRAIIQTHNPENEVLGYAKNQMYEDFYKREIDKRKALRFPPIYDFFTFVITGENETSVVRASVRLCDRIKYLKKTVFPSVFVLGPVPAKIVKINKKYRYILTIRLDDSEQKRKFIAGLLKEFMSDKINKGVQLFVDLDGEN